MIRELDDTLKQLLIQKGGLDPAAVDIRFDAPSRDQSAAPTHPTVNLYLYDVHENVELREMRWDTEREGNRKVRIKRVPLRMDLSYSVTCWASAPEDQHQLLWRVLETLSRNSPLPDDLLQGDLKEQVHQVQTRVAQPDGVLKNPADLWSALKTEPAPSINLVATLDLDLDKDTITPLVFARVVKLSQLKAQAEMEGPKDELMPAQIDWEAGPVRLGGVVESTDGQLIDRASVRLLAKQADGKPVQVGPTVQTDESGRYVFSQVPAGQYMLVVEVAGQAPQQQPLNVAVLPRGQPLPELLHEVEVKMAKPVKS
jgi:hypothetical protein